MIYGLDATGRPVVERSISTKLVLPKSADDCEIMHAEFGINHVIKVISCGL